MKVQTKTRLFPVLISGFMMALCFMACNNEVKDKAEDCTITFDLGFTTSKNPPAAITVKKGEAAGSKFPKAPSRSLCDFTGWKDPSGTVYDRTTIIKNDVTLTASWYFAPGPENPFITDRFTADPAAFVDNGTVYIVCGEDTLPPNASATEYFRISQWLIYSTRDMKTFTFEKVLMKSEDFSYGQVNSAWASQAIKSPEDGRYYFYGTVQSSQGQVVSVARADSPTGPYKQATTNPLVTRSMVTSDLKKSHENIDPTVFIDDDGTAWLAWGQENPCIAKLKSNMTEIERPIRFLFPEDGSWTSEDRYEEGPFLYKRKRKYYMIYASMKMNGNNPVAETISYAMANSLEGPWTNGVRITDCAPGLDGQGNSYTIHPAVLDFKGQTYLFYHNAALRVTQEDGSVWAGATGRRSLCVDYLYFNDDGTIQFVDVRNPAGLSVPPED